MGKDITTTFNAWSYNTELFEEAFAKTGNEIPVNSTEVTLPKLILGAGYQFDIGRKFSGLFEVNTDFTFDGKRNVLISADPVSVDPHFGLEIDYNNLVFLRGGIQNIQNEKDFDGSTSKIIQPNMGLGIRLGKITIDWALTNIGKSSLYSNIFSLKFDINKSQ